MEKSYDFKSMTVMKIIGNRININRVLSDLEEISSEKKVSRTELGRYMIRTTHLNELTEYIILWERKEPLEIHRLSDDGTIEPVVNEIYDLSEILIWTFRNESPYIFVFFKNTTQQKAEKLINSIFEDLQLSRVELNNSFFEHFIHSISNCKVKKITYSLPNNSSMSLSSANDESLRFEKSYYGFEKSDYGIITEMTVEIYLDNLVRFRVSNKGTITLYNKPSYGAVFELTKSLINILLKDEFDGGIYHE